MRALRRRTHTDSRSIADGRCERLHSDCAALHRPPDVGFVRRVGCAELCVVRVGGVHHVGHHRIVRPQEALRGGTQLPEGDQEGHEVERRDAEDDGRPRELRGSRRRGTGRH